MPIITGLKRGNYSWWSRKSAKQVDAGGDAINVDEQINALGYIEHLASSTSTDASEWDIVKRFGDNGVEIETDRTKINAIFFELLATAAEVEPDEADALVEENAADVAEQALAMAAAVENLVVDGRKQRFARELTSHDRTLASLVESLQETRRARLEATIAFKSISVSGFMSKNIEALTEQTYWVMEKCLDPSVGIMYLRSRGPVVVNYRDDTLNFGFLRVKLDFINSSLTVLPCRQNLFKDSDNYFHPHISNSGEVCWGNAEGTVQQALGSGDFARVLELLQAVLVTYNPESPYVSFEDFKERGRAVRDYRKLRIIERERSYSETGRAFDFYAPEPPPEPVLDDEGDEQGQYEDDDDEHGDNY